MNFSRSTEDSVLLGKWLQYSMLIDVRVDSHGTVRTRVEESSPVDDVIPYCGVSYFHLIILWFSVIIKDFF